MKNQFIFLAGISMLLIACSTPSSNTSTPEPPIIKQNPEVSTDLKELVGTYTLGGHHESWALTILPEGDAISVKYYLIDGMLPPKDRELSVLFTPRVLKEFVVSKDGAISSDLGKGQYGIIDGVATITFEGIKSHISDELELVKR